MEPKGKIIAIGGNEHSRLDGEDYAQRNNPDFIPEEILRRFIEECKEGTRSLIGIVPTSSSSPRSTAESFREVFHSLGCHRTEILDIRSEDEANNPENLRLLKKLDGILFTGGDQVRISKFISNTLFNKLLCKKFMNEEFVVAGTSSGAMAMADIMISRGSSMEGFIKGEVELTEGLSLVRNVIIDSHFDSRGRFGRLVQAACKRGALGIGIGDDTAIIITGEQTLQIIGSGIVTIVDTSKIKESNFDELKDGIPFTVKNLIVHVLSRRDVFKIKNLFKEKAKKGEMENIEDLEMISHG